MKEFELIAPCHFGMEAILKREINDLGLSIVSVEDGRITFRGDESAVCRANIFLRTAERVLIKAASFKAVTYDELFEGVKAVRWEEFIPENGKFWVTKASGIKSKLFSPSDIQSIVKKAIVEELKGVYKRSWFEESGDPYPLRVTIMKDIVTIGLDTTGESLHKRGYRKLVSRAPVSENLAAAMIMLSPWKADRILVDPFCGCGTIPIEAAMIAAKIAPGLNRSFTAENWTNIIEKKNWYRAAEEADSLINMDIEAEIIGYDIDGDIIAAARENARMADVEKLIRFKKQPVSELEHRGKYGFIITNPPYGERVGDKEALPALYKELSEGIKRLDSWSAFIITGFEDVEKYMGRKADRNRKVYNGMMKTYIYQFMGKPPGKMPVGGLKHPENT
ncbi:MAG: class I SAM-dependent RNA methyltransferase [Lachnospiraceae bacterium]|nr:class I SAM-dependent RNA methyltransferase [Lachnospiraceae bacterium]